jgi:motility quorum-sensing regulator/GCU-specific mRNA interferase toxin
MAEKRKPTYDLEAFKAAFDDVDKLRVTGAALRGAAALGFGRAEIVATLQTMQRPHFYKSMTTFGNHRVWQDRLPRSLVRGAALREIYCRRLDAIFADVV